MQKEILQYEYCDIADYDYKKFNELGQQGWEMVVKSHGQMLTFKRPCGVITMDLPEYVMKKNNNNSYDR